MSYDAKTLCETFATLQAERSPFEQKWRDIADYVRPVRQEFRSMYSSGELPNDPNPYITDATAFIAQDGVTHSLYSFLSNEANEWLVLKTFDDDLNNFHTAKTWLSIVSRRILNSFGPAVTAFYSQVPEFYGDVSIMGTGIFFSEWMTGQQQIYDQAYSPFDCYLMANNYRQVDTNFRPFWFTKRQIKQQWPDVKLPDSMEKEKDTTKFMILHVVMPNEDYSDGAIGPRGFPFVDCYILYDKNVDLQRGGRYSLGYKAARWAGTNLYGFGLGHRVLPDTKTSNAFDRGMLENAEWQNHPAPLLPDRESISRVRPVPRKPIYGGMSMSGRRLVDFLAPNGNIAITHEMMRERRDMIREGLFYSILQLAGRTGMTQLESMQRDEEKMRAIGQYLARIQREFLAPLVVERFQMLWRAGQLPPPPPELQNQPLKTEYTSPMAQAQKSAQGAAAIKLVDATIALMQVNPEVADTLDADDIVRTYQDAFGAKPSNILSPEAVAEKRAARLQMQQMQTGLEMGETGANIVQKLSSVAVPRNDGRRAA